MRIAMLVVMAATVSLGSTASNAIDPGAPMEVEHYDIRGTTWEELVRQIDSKGPEGSWGNAHTSIQYKFQMTQPAGGACAVTSVQVDANAKVSLPRWVNRSEGSASLQETWDSSYRALALHERGHVQINLDGTRDLERALKAISPQPTCDETKKLAHQVADRIISEVSQRQNKYDAETDHGRRQPRG